MFPFIRIFAIMKLIVGMDAKRIVRNGTGLGSYGRTLANNLSRRGGDDLQLLLYAPDAGRDDLRRQMMVGDNMHFRFPAGQPSSLRKALWRSHGIISDLLSDHVQVYHGLSGGIKGVVTIHDLIFMRHPEFYHWIDTKIYEWKFRQTLREADRIIAISERTKRDIMELGGVDEERIDLVYQSCSPRFATTASAEELQSIRQRYGLPARFMLSVGTIEERKNTMLALRALPLLPDDIALVLVGRETPYAVKLRKLAERNGLSHRLHLLHGVPDLDLAALYQQAEVFVYPSRYEGFGIPVIEAIHCGLPVVACTGSCLEEAGGPDSLYVSPDDETALAAAVTQVLRGANGREERIARSRQYVKRFEGLDVAAQVLEVYRKLV